MVKVRWLRGTRRGQSGNTLTLTSDDANELGVEDGTTYRLAVGSWQGPVRVRVREEGRSTCVARVPWRLPYNSMTIHMTENGVLRVGPLLGIMIMYRMTRRGPRGSQLGTYVEIMRRARTMGIGAFIFRAENIQPRQGRVVGWTYTGRRWRRVVAPLPDAVYNRISSRGVERRVRRRGIIRRLRTRGVPVFNPRYLNKWGVHRTLVQDEHVRQYLPATRRYRRPSDVLPILNRYGQVFLKPSGGSLGLGAMRVQKRGRVLRYTMNTMTGRNRIGRLRHVQGLYRVLPRRGDYIAQQAINLPRINGRYFDVRALVQKDGNGLWKVTGAAVRIAGRGRITTHVPRGGRRSALRPVLRRVFGEEHVEHIEEQIHDACLRSAAGLQRLTGEPFAELSLDIAVDTQRRVWILEINSKPFRFDEVHLRRRAQRRLLHYVTHLAGCRPPEEEESQQQMSLVAAGEGAR